MIAPRYRERPMALVPRGQRNHYSCWGCAVPPLTNSADGSNNDHLPAWCYDHLSPSYPRVVTDGDLELVRRHVVPVRVKDLYHRHQWSGLFAKQVNEWVNSYAATNVSWWGSPPSLPSMNYDVEILNRISPVKRSADVPYELIEGLRDLGSILKALAQIRRGRSIPSFVNASSVAGGYVKYQFGIKPYIRLIQDLSVLNQDMIRANLRLRKIEQKKRIRVNLLNNTTEWTSTSSLSAGYTWTLIQGVPREHRQLDKVWAVGKLSLTPSGDSLLRRLSTSPAFFRRFQLNLGNVDIKTLWELTPWSWLADWVVDVSSALEAQRNSVYFQATSWNVMHYQTYRVHHKYSSRRLGGAENSLLEYEGGSYWREVKRRRVRASLQWHRARIEPILTLDRAAILSSILSSHLLGSSTYRPRR